MEDLLENLKNLFKFVTDSCRRQNHLKFFEIRRNLSKIEAVNKESVYFFQIFERFTNIHSTGAKNSRRNSKIRPSKKKENKFEAEI